MTNPIFNDLLQEQQEKIEEVRRKCIENYGGNVIDNFVSTIFNSSTNTFYCPASWDGITCWPSVPAGTIATQNCSSLSYIKGFGLENIASKHCLKTGYWLMKEGIYWTNFTQCHQQNDTTVILTHHKIIDAPTVFREYLPMLKGIKEIGYLVSLLTLLVAILIMLTIRKLHCARNILHIHLFASFILRAFIFLLKDATFVDGIGLRSDFLGYRNGTFFNIDLTTNNWQCKLLTSLWQYFTMANYSWILMEGLYLYNLIFRALFADSSGSILGYIAMGWGFPLMVVAPWVLGKMFMEDILCWTTNSSDIYLMIDIPTLLSVIVNLIFFIRISMVLLNKLKSPLNEDNRRCYMKWAKSTLVLVPLFGVNYVLFLGLKYISNDATELIWIACDSLFGSFQGFFVAVLYCFLNGEVKAELKPHLYRILPFLATNRLFRICFPCREKFLRSTKGRISICTTLSCSSMYANGLLHTRSNLRIKDCHHCQNSKKNSQDTLCSTPRNSMNMCNTRKQSHPQRDLNHDDSMEMSHLFHPELKHSQEEYLTILSEQC